MFVFYPPLNKRLSKQSWGGCWFETSLCTLWRHCNGHVMQRYGFSRYMQHSMWMVWDQVWSYQPRVRNIEKPIVLSRRNISCIHQQRLILNVKLIIVYDIHEYIHEWNGFKIRSRDICNYGLSNDSCNPRVQQISREWSGIVCSIVNPRAA